MIKFVPFEEYRRCGGEINKRDYNQITRADMGFDLSPDFVDKIQLKTDFLSVDDFKLCVEISMYYPRKSLAWRMTESLTLQGKNDL